MEKELEKPVSKKEVEENRIRSLQRKRLYKTYGYDQDASRDFILSKCLPVGNTVLEIGTGKGHMTVLLAKNSEQVVSVDKSEEELHYAKLNTEEAGVSRKINYIICDAERLPFPDREFGSVVSVNAFHHFEKPFAVLKEMIRVCGGKLIVADFNNAGFEVIRQVHRDEGREHEEQCGDFSIVGQYMKEYGFSVNKYEDCNQVVYVGERK